MWTTIIVQPIFNLLLVIYGLVGDFGVAIIVFTLIVKLLMWPLVKKQMIQTKLMRKIQPELAEIKKRNKGNRQAEALQMMDLYKRNNVKPFRSILVLIVQLPIFIALFTVIRTMTMPPIVDDYYGGEAEYGEVAGGASGVATGGDRIAEFAYEPVKSLERVRRMIDDYDSFEPRLFGLVDLNVRALPFEGVSSAVIWVFIVLAGFTQYFMAKQTMPTDPSKKRRKLKEVMKEAADGKEADQGEINSIVSGNMMKVLPIFVGFIMITMPGALAFYFFVTNLVTAGMQRTMLHRLEDEMEATADKKILKDLRNLENVQEAEIVKTKKKNGGVRGVRGEKRKRDDRANVTRISATDKKRRKR